MPKENAARGLDPAWQIPSSTSGSFAGFCRCPCPARSLPPICPDLTIRVPGSLPVGTGWALSMRAIKNGNCRMDGDLSGWEK